MSEKLLEIRNMTVRFSGVVAVDNLNITLEKGKVYGLIGTNGAGKSTVVNVISGNMNPTSGEILFEGRHIEKNPAHRSAEEGIARTFQNLRLLHSDTVLGNVITARQLKHHYNLLQMLLSTPSYRRKEQLIREESMEFLRKMHIEDFAEHEAGSLSYGQQRRLEISRCLAIEPKLLLLDEPAAGMNPNESRQLVEDIRAIHKEDPDMTILLIEHDMKVVMSFCEHIFVMAQGRLIEEGDPETITSSEKVISAYMGGGELA